MVTQLIEELTQSEQWGNGEDSNSPRADGTQEGNDETGAQKPGLLTETRIRAGAAHKLAQEKGMISRS